MNGRDRDLTGFFKIALALAIVFAVRVSAFVAAISAGLGTGPLTGSGAAIAPVASDRPAATRRTFRIGIPHDGKPTA